MKAKKKQRLFGECKKIVNRFFSDKNQYLAITIHELNNLFSNYGLLSKIETAEVGQKTKITIVNPSKESEHTWKFFKKRIKSKYEEVISNGNEIIVPKIIF